MRRPGRIAVVVVLLALGCGYSSQSLIDSRYKTVYVETFDNQSFYRGFELTLTRALINEINRKTHLRIVPREQADTVLSGQISDFKQVVLTEDADDNVRESEVRVTIDMTWTDRRTNQPIKTVRGFVGSEQIKFDIGETLETATSELFYDVAEDLIEQLEADW